MRWDLRYAVTTEETPVRYQERYFCPSTLRWTKSGSTAKKQANRIAYRTTSIALSGVRTVSRAICRNIDVGNVWLGPISQKPTNNCTIADWLAKGNKPAPAKCSQLATQPTRTNPTLARHPPALARCNGNAFVRKGSQANQRCRSTGCYYQSSHEGLEVDCKVEPKCRPKEIAVTRPSGVRASNASDFPGGFPGTTLVRRVQSIFLRSFGVDVLEAISPSPVLVEKANSHAKRGRCRTALPGKGGANDGVPSAVLIRGAAATLGSDKPLPVRDPWHSSSGPVPWVNWPW